MSISALAISFDAHNASSVTKKWATTGSHSSSSDLLVCADLSQRSAEEPLVSLIRNQEDQ